MTWSDHEHVGLPTPFPFGTNASHDESSKTLAAARHAALDAAAQNTQESPELLVPVTLRAPGGLPAALEPADANVAEPTLAPAGALDQDPYYYLLAAEMQRLHAEYAGGAPPTYISDDGSEAASIGAGEAARPPVHRKHPKPTTLTGAFGWRLDEKQRDE
jgi:hypothetical protein